MKCECFILAFVVVGCVLLLQIGCQGPVVEPPETVCEGGVCRIAPEPTTQPTASKERGIATTKTRITEPEVKKKEPRITFENVVHDFGEIAPKTALRCEFKFTNTGHSLLKITEVTKTCGCTPYTLAKKEYAPGETGILKVRYKADSHPRAVKKTLYVSSNDETKPKVKLTIKAKIVAKVAHEPQELKLLLTKENAGCPEITLRSLDDKPFAIKRFKSSAGCITVDYDPSVEKTEFVLEPKVDIEKLKKGLNGNITINLTHPGCHKVNIPFKTLPRFAADPRRLNIFNFEPQKPITREVWVLNNYDEDFEVESVSSKRGYIRVLSQEKADNRYKFKLEITPPAVEGKIRTFMDVFSVNMKGGEKLEIPCRGYSASKRKKSPSR